MDGTLPGELLRTVPILRIGLIAIAVVVVVFSAYAWALYLTAETRLQWAKARFERDVGPLDPQRYAPPAVPDEQNAAIPIRAALDAIPRKENGQIDGKAFGEFGPCAREGIGKLTADEEGRLRGRVEARAAVLALLEQAIERSASNWNLPYGRTVQYSIRPASDARELVDLAACDARLALADSDPDRALLRLESVLRVAATQQHEAELVYHGLGAAWEGRAWELFPELLRMPAIDLDRLERAIPEGEPYAQWRRAFAAGSARSQSLMLQIGAEDERDSTRTWKALFSAGRLQREVEFVLAADRSRTAAADTAPTPWYSLGWLRMIEDLGSERRFLDRTLALKAQRAMAHRAIALVREARRNGAYPPSLEPPSTAADDPLGERPLAYTVHDDGSATLSAPGAIETLRRPNKEPEGLEWRLPAPEGSRLP